MTLVTISATYGSGGSRVAPALAERLRVPFLARPPAPDLTPSATRSARATNRAAAPAACFARHLARARVGDARRYGARRVAPRPGAAGAIEQEIHELAAGGEGVILGRGAAVILHDALLDVLLDGTEEARVARRWRSRASTARPPSAGSTASTASAAPTSRRSTASI